MIHYYIHDCGDGSVILRTCETEELACYLDELQEAFGEDSTGSIDATPNPSFKFHETRFSNLIDLLQDCDDQNEINEFVNQFYPNGVKFKYDREEKVNNKYVYCVFKLGQEEIKVFTSNPSVVLSLCEGYLE